MPPVVRTCTQSLFFLSITSSTVPEFRTVITSVDVLVPLRRLTPVVVRTYSPVPGSSLGLSSSLPSSLSAGFTELMSPEVIFRYCAEK